MDRVLLRTINLKNYDDNTINGFNQPQEENLRPILRVETAVAASKKGKSDRVDNISADFVQAGEETQIWRTRKWHTPRTQSLIITLSIKVNL